MVLNTVKLLWLLYKYKSQFTQLLDKILVLLFQCYLFYQICEFLPCHTFSPAHYFQDTFYWNVHTFQDFGVRRLETV